LGPGDLDADHVVGLSDFQWLFACMGGPTPIMAYTCPPEIADSADTDFDGDRDLADFAAIANRFGQTFFDFGPERQDKEAEYHAISLAGQLRAPDEEYDRISRDLRLIRDAHADLIDVRDHRIALLNGLFVRLQSSEDHNEIDLLNEHYVYTSRNIYWNELFYIQYCDVLYPTVLGAIYEQSDQVEYTHGDGFGCIPPCCWNQVEVAVEGTTFTYDFSFYYDPSDSFVSCGCRRTRVIKVDEAGTISQVSCEDSCLPDCP
jgi:hypothetical protein